MPRVYHLIKSLGRGGAETLLVENLRFSDSTRFQYGYGYFLPWKNALEDDLETHGAHVHCFNCSGNLSILAAARRVSAQLRLWRADVVHCHLPLAGIVGRIAGRMAGIPVVYTEHNRMERYHPLTRRASLLTWRWQRLVIAVSQEVSQSILAHAGDATPVRVILNGVDTDRFDRTRTDATRMRRELAIPATSPVLGTVAVFRSQKRLSDWLEAARLLSERHPELHFLMVGDGPLRDDIHRQSRELGLESVVHFPGLQEDVRPYLAAMDLFMISSVFEGLPIALLEAMAMRCGIVSTAVGGIPEVIAHGENGVLVEPRDPSALADAVSGLIADLPRAERMGRSARLTVERQLGLRRMTLELESAYMDVLRNGGHGG